MIPLVYHPSYDLNLGAHVFPAQKYRLIRERLADSPVHTPEPATDAQVQLVHSPAWTTALRDGTLTPRQLQTLEIPWSPATAPPTTSAAASITPSPTTAKASVPSTTLPSPSAPSNPKA
jgi:acetoin utilization deacetylase AcuC-like enzyme